MSYSFHRKHTLTALVVGLTLAFGAAAQTGTISTPSINSSKAPNPTAAAKKPNPDQSFVEKAAMGGMAEVELGNLAQQKASHDDVKQFGSRMVQDHGKANDELKQIATAKGVDLPASLDKKHRKDVERLGKLSGADFDKAYMRHMVSDHKKEVAEFKKQATAAKDAEVKGFASKTLPTLQEHLQLAQKTNDALAKGNGTMGSAKKTGAK